MPKNENSLRRIVLEGDSKILIMSLLQEEENLSWIGLIVEEIKMHLKDFEAAYY